MKPGEVVLKTDLSKDLNRALGKLTKNRVLVGVPSTTAERDDGADGEALAINNAAIAYIQDNGSPAAHIPPRPFMQPGVMDAKDKITETYKKGAQDVLSRPDADFDDVHHKVGLATQSAIQQHIEDGPFQPLADSTLAGRKAAGFAGEKPLIVTGQLRRAITYVIREKS